MNRQMLLVKSIIAFVSGIIMLNEMKFLTEILGLVAVTSTLLLRHCTTLIKEFFNDIGASMNICFAIRRYGAFNLCGVYH